MIVKLLYGLPLKEYIQYFGMKYFVQNVLISLLYYIVLIIIHSCYIKKISYL